MNQHHSNPDQNPIDRPEEQTSAPEDSPRFGRLLLVLIAAVLMVVVITFSSQALYS